MLTSPFLKILASPYHIVKILNLKLKLVSPGLISRQVAIISDDIGVDIGINMLYLTFFRQDGNAGNPRKIGRIK
jgi:hypothetical protein